MKKICFVLLPALVLLSACSTTPDQTGNQNANVNTNTEVISTEQKAYDCAIKEAKEVARGKSTGTPILASFKESSIAFLPSNQRWRVIGRSITRTVGSYVCTVGTQGGKDSLECDDAVCGIY